MREPKYTRKELMDESAPVAICALVNVPENTTLGDVINILVENYIAKPPAEKKQIEWKVRYEGDTWEIDPEIPNAIKKLMDRGPEREAEQRRAYAMVLELCTRANASAAEMNRLRQAGLLPWPQLEVGGAVQ